MHLESLNTLNSNDRIQLKKKSLNVDQKTLAHHLLISQTSKSFSYWKPVSLNLHSHSVLSLAISPCNTLLASGSLGGTLVVYNLDEQRDELTMLEKFGPLHSIAFSPDGNYIACGQDDGLIDILNLKLKNSEQIIKVASRMVQFVIFSPNGKFISYLDNKSVVFWNLIYRNEEFRLNGHENMICTLVFSAKGEHLITGSKDKKIIFWNMRKQKKDFELLEENEVYLIAISNNGKYLASSSNRFYLSLWSVKKKQKNHDFEITNARSSIFSPDSKYLSASDDFCVKVWDIQKGTLIFNLSAKTSLVKSIIFSLDQKKLFAACSNSKIYTWKLKFKKLVRAPYMNLKGIDLIAISRNSKLIAYLNQKKLKILNLKNNQKAYKLKYSNSALIKIIKFSHNSKYLMIVNKDGLAIWHLNSNKIKFKLVLPNPLEFSAVSKSMNLVSVKESPNTLLVYDTEKNNIILKIFYDTLKIFNKGSFSLSTDFSPDNKFIACSNPNIQIWNIVGKCIEYSFENSESCSVLLYSEDGNYIFGGLFNGTIKAWNCIERTKEITLNGTISKIISLQFSCKYLVSISIDGNIILWNFKQKRVVFKMYCKDKYCNSIALSYDNKYFIEKSDDNFLSIWKLAEFLELNTLFKYEYKFLQLKFSNNGKYAVCGYEKIIKLWSVIDKKEILSFYAHKHWVRSVAFSNDSNFIVSGADDNLVKIWNLEGFEVKRFKGHLGWVLAVCFSVDGKFVSSASNDKILKVWDVDSSKEKVSINGFEEKPNTVSFCRNGKYVAVEYICRVFAVFKI